MAKLKALEGRTRKKTSGLTDEEAHELIRAYRRGVTTTTLADVVGCARGAVYAHVGVWALRNLKV